MGRIYPFGFNNYQTIVGNIKNSQRVKRPRLSPPSMVTQTSPSIVSLVNQGIKGGGYSCDGVLCGRRRTSWYRHHPLVGRLAAWNYFESVKNPVNIKFVMLIKNTPLTTNCQMPIKVVTNDPMETTYVGINMWKQAVEKAAPPTWIKSVLPWQVKALPRHPGYTLTMDAENHHLHKPVMIGQIHCRWSV